MKIKSTITGYSLVITTLLVIIIMCDISLTQVTLENLKISNLNRHCMSCLCQAASGCNLTSGCVKGYCGPFKISKLYWKDAGEVILPDDDKERDGAYEDCAINYHCAQRIVINYLIRFGRDCNENGVTDCYDFSMINFNGGFQCQSSLERNQFGQAWLNRYYSCNPETIGF